MHPYVSIYLCLYLFSYLPPCLCVSVAFYVNTTVLFVSAEDPESYEHMEGWGWLVVDGCQWWGIHWGCLVDDGQRFRQPTSPLFPALSHPVIRVTVRSCLAPIGHANNSFNNPGPCNISLLFGPRCHAKSPAMEKQLHCRKDGMTGWTLSGYVCVCFCIWQTDHSINSSLRFSSDLFVLVRPFYMCVPLHKCMSVLTQSSV